MRHWVHTGATGMGARVCHRKGRGCGDPARTSHASLAEVAGGSGGATGWRLGWDTAGSKPLRTVSFVAVLRALFRAGLGLN